MSKLRVASRIVRGWVVATLALVGCDDAQPAPPVRLGLLAALTAAGNEGNGRVERRSVELAVEEANAAGGPLPGRRVELVPIDYGETATTVLAAGDVVADAGLTALVGPEPTIVETLLVAGFLDAHLPHVSCCASSDSLDTAGGQMDTERFFFRTTPRDSAESVVTSRVIRECASCNSLIVFHQDDSYGNPFASRLVDDLAAHGGPPVAVEVAFPQGQSSYQTQVETAGLSSATCAVVIGFPADSGRIMRNWQTYVGRAVSWFAASPVGAAAFITELGNRTLAAGMLVASPTADPLDPHVVAFRTLYEGRFHESPSLVYAARNYDAAALLLLAIARARSTDGVLIRDAIFEISRPDPEDAIVGPGNLAKGIALAQRGLGIDYEGASGSVDFDSSGNVTADYEILRYDAAGYPVSLGLARPANALPCAP